MHMSQVATPAATIAAAAGAAPDVVTLTRAQYDDLSRTAGRIKDLEIKMAEFQKDSEEGLKAFHPKTEEGARDGAVRYWLKKTGMSDAEIEAELAKEEPEVQSQPNAAKKGTGGASPDMEAMLAARLKPLEDSLREQRQQAAEAKLKAAIDSAFEGGDLKAVVDAMGKLDKDTVGDFRGALTEQLRQRSLQELDGRLRSVGRFDESMIGPSVKAAADAVAKPLRSLGKVANSIGRSADTASVEEFFEKRSEVKRPDGPVRSLAEVGKLDDWAASQLVDTLRPNAGSEGAV